MKKIAFIITLMLSTAVGYSETKPRGVFELLIYRFQTDGQEKQLDAYLSQNLIPALHRQDISKIGVFKPLTNEGAESKQLYILIPHKSLNAFAKSKMKLAKDQVYQRDASAYLNADSKSAPYSRMETILLNNFNPDALIEVPKLNAPRKERVYELRSYESPTEKYHINKLEMFIGGKETKIFQDINANPVFYGSVISGSTMPNLMYMTAFENKADRDEKWKAFGTNPDWQKLKVMEIYKGNVSKNVIVFLRPTDYSDI